MSCIVRTALAQRAALRSPAHRPWPLPDGPWVMGQTWVDLLFCHWPVPVEHVRPHVPAGVPLDTFDGSAWLSITPFEVRGSRVRGTLPPPVLSRFPELNVRTYVRLGGRPGIWFFSLDAASALAVNAARLLYRLPYFRADMEIVRDGDWIDYRSDREDGRGARTRFAARYRAAGGVRHAAPGSLEAWLVERYRLYAADRSGRVYAGDIHHRPWTLRDAVADIRQNTMTAPHGIALDDAPLVQFAKRQDVVFWPLRRVARGGL